MTDKPTPYACNLEMSGAAFSSEVTRMVLKRLFLLIASGTKKRRLALIGHIKGFCLGLEKDFLKISFVSDKGGVDISGPWCHGSDRISLTLNIIVVGVSRQELSEIVDEAVKEIQSEYRVTVVRERDRLL